jgi:probable addiction module antidote protein
VVRVTEFDPSAFLGNDEVVAEYLTTALEEDNPDVFLAAVGHVVKGRGHRRNCRRRRRRPREPLEGRGAGAKPRYDTVLKVLHSLGVKLTVSAA